VSGVLFSVGLCVRPVDLFTCEEVVVFDRWPQNSAAQFRSDSDAEVVELGASALLDVRQVDKEGVDANALQGDDNKKTCEPLL